MALIEIPMNSYRYHFRSLTWREEARLKFPKGVDQRKVVLAAAMVDVSGMSVTPLQSMRIFDQLPEALLWRIWLLYRGSLPPERYYISGGLYAAPDSMNHNRTIQAEEQQSEDVADAVHAKLTQQFGATEVRDADDVGRQMFRHAQAAGTLVRAAEDPSDG